MNAFAGVVIIPGWVCHFTQPAVSGIPLLNQGESSLDCSLLLPFASTRVGGGGGRFSTYYFTWILVQKGLQPKESMGINPLSRPLFKVLQQIQPVEGLPLSARHLASHTLGIPVCHLDLSEELGQTPRWQR